MNCDPQILVINTGSSSLKVTVTAKALSESESSAIAATTDTTPDETKIVTGAVERIGDSGPRLRLRDAGGATLIERECDAADHAAALHAILADLANHNSNQSIGAVGHRIVHGGSQFRESQLVTPELLVGLEQLIPIAPNHLPQAIQAIRGASQAFPEVPQVVCFDTAFHRHMPRTAQIFALPRHFADEGVIRYGFHGLSYESIVHQLRSVAPHELSGRVIIAHLGNGASMAAVRGGIGIDTTMGFTPTAGLLMGTRVGDIDPGVLVYLLVERGMSPGELGELVTLKSGLLGVSGSSSDMRDLTERESADSQAAEAVALFCYQARKHLGALTAILGGLDTLIFTGGIGERATSIRRRICEGFEFLGIRLDEKRNEEHAPVISVFRPGSPRDGNSVTVRVMQTDEDLMIARQTRTLIGASPLNF
jgi:acetate kinase